MYRECVIIGNIYQSYNMMRLITNEKRTYVMRINVAHHSAV